MSDTVSLLACRIARLETILGISEEGSAESQPKLLQVLETVSRPVYSRLDALALDTVFDQVEHSSFVAESSAASVQDAFEYLCVSTDRIGELGKLFEEFSRLCDSVLVQGSQGDAKVLERMDDKRLDEIEEKLSLDERLLIGQTAEIDNAVLAYNQLVEQSFRTLLLLDPPGRI
eukprot:ANDGO_03921.mRNA.1 hypothetical protein